MLLKELGRFIKLVVTNQFGTEEGCSLRLFAVLRVFARNAVFKKEFVPRRDAKDRKDAKKRYYETKYTKRRTIKGSSLQVRLKQLEDSFVFIRPARRLNESVIFNRVNRELPVCLSKLDQPLH